MRKIRTQPLFIVKNRYMATSTVRGNHAFPFEWEEPQESLGELQTPRFLVFFLMLLTGVIQHKQKISLEGKANILTR